MYYFVPSWYNKGRSWYDETPVWFRAVERMSFDDSISIYKMFRGAGEQACLLILNYQPQFRYFLHKHDMLGASYWSLFDDIQNISRTHTQAIDFKQLAWPEGTRFIYSPFAVVAIKGSETLAQIHFAENGNLFYITRLEDGKAKLTYYFDDRGFVSSIAYHDDNGTQQHQDYLNEHGVWQVREHLTGDKHLEINPKADKLFQRLDYASWEDLFKERLRLFQLEKMTGRDTVITAADCQHNNLVLTVFKEQDKVFSFFGQRYDYQNKVDFEQVLAQAKLLIIDTKEEGQRLIDAILKQDVNRQLPKISQISPFDTRLRLGNSQMVKELIIYFFMDTISEAELKDALKQLLKEMAKNPLIELQLVTFNHGRSLTQLEAYLKNYIQDHYPIKDFMAPKEDAGENQIDDISEMELTRIRLNCFNNEAQIIQALDTTRLVIDLGEKPDQYTQIASISAGVPQVNKQATEYVTHLENGIVLGAEFDLSKALAYYFEGLANWNASLVHTVQKMADYTSGRLLQEWKSLLEEGEN